jgi:hypothetical protein
MTSIIRTGKNGPEPSGLQSVSPSVPPEGLDGQVHLLRPVAKIRHKRSCNRSLAAPERPAGNKLRIGINSNPQPYIAGVGIFLAAISGVTFRCFALIKADVSSTCRRQQARLRKTASWYAAATIPASTSNRLTVFSETPVILTVGRIEQTSNNAEITWVGVLKSSLFLGTTILSPL